MAFSRRVLRVIKWLLLSMAIVIAILFTLFSYQNEVTKNVDSYVYELPFEKGAKHRVVQGYGGLFSHIHTAAVDFTMPVGTSVFAAREGTVYSYKDDSNEGGFMGNYKNKANYLIIQHDDGSF